MNPFDKYTRAFDLAWIIQIPSLNADRVTIDGHDVREFKIEKDSPTIVVPCKYMLDYDDKEEALFSAICQLMPRRTRVKRKPDDDLCCFGMNQCYWLKGTGWLDEPREGAVYIDPFDVLKKTPFLYKV